MKSVSFWPVVCLLLSVPVAAGAQSPDSPAAAKTLCDLMTAKHLDAIAARDASHPDRFVAAMLFPHAELLVVSAKYTPPESLQVLLDQKNYKEVYGALQTAAADQVFFIDMKADGLSAEQPDSADVVYEPGNKQTVFDESWRKQHGLGEREYQQKYQAADQLYGSLLKTLTAALNGPAQSQ